jgi:hypothetical protein
MWPLRTQHQEDHHRSARGRRRNRVNVEAVSAGNWLLLHLPSPSDLHFSIAQGCRG